LKRCTFLVKRKYEEMCAVKQTYMANELYGIANKEVHEQNEQVQRDARKLQMLPERLTKADKLIKKIESSMWSSGSVNKEYSAPPITDGDAEYKVNLKRTLNHSRRLRLTRIGMLLLKQDTVHEARSFRALRYITVLQNGFIELVFRGRFKKKEKEFEQWLMSARDQTYEIPQLVRNIVMRADDNVAHTIEVRFEEGAEDFDPQYVRRFDPNIKTIRNNEGNSTNVRVSAGAYSEGTGLPEFSTGDIQRDDTFHNQLNKGLIMLKEIRAVEELEQSILSSQRLNPIESIRIDALDQRLRKIGR